MEVGGGASAATSSTQQPAPTASVVGRTLSSYFAGDVQKHQETVTYTVYNEQADPETGVLLTTTLGPMVTFESASQQPDRNGQNLAWSLGTIQGYENASVTLTVALGSSTATQLDSGARAFATLDAGAVSAATAAATLSPGSADPSLLAATPDANSTNLYIQEEAVSRSRLRPDADLQLPPHPDRLQRLPWFGTRCAGDALVERAGNFGSTSPAWASP